MACPDEKQHRGSTDNANPPAPASLPQLIEK